ncbi:plasmid pRiA4b ORF-3 family protein [Verrucomicrobiaceae bacterium N1E253]|uniref:Plasmid pRiA4b ORF-3 family protein n=1 Tax=Oceaniferula marina TaxID=2748318 RepID=A0A851GIE4_9BACT|nr:plasmid pRiA4b ORF-3 family protein [Oceaniferula marina]NWK56702.1 plasmid pRiA4b ORF-3 family protein [Oceaniferula marina]
MASYTIKVFLYEVEPEIWRRFTIPAEASFAELHRVIQKAMGWNDEQSHQFRHGKGRHLGNVIADTKEQVAPGDDFKDEKDVRICDVVGRRRLPLRMMYRYDFYDDWTHELVIEQKGEEEDAPKLLGGERACPPEDCGGAFGYRECVAGFDEWMDDDYDPEAFDPDAVELK